MGVSLENQLSSKAFSAPLPARKQTASAAASAAPASPDGGKAPATAPTDTVSPDEGAALIRAFLKIRRREVRSALIELTLSLSARM
jgi:hypothetical protein